MIRAFQIVFVIAAAALLAACSHLRAAKQRLEYRGFLEEWGVKKPHTPWIYAPLLGVVMSCFGTGCDLMEGLHQTNPNYRKPVPFSSNWWERREERLRR